MVYLTSNVIDNPVDCSKLMDDLQEVDLAAREVSARSLNRGSSSEWFRDFRSRKPTRLPELPTASLNS